MHYKKLIRTCSAAFTIVFVISQLSCGASIASATNPAFAQTDWSGGQTVNVADDANNQVGWNQYGMKDGNVATGSDMRLSSSSNVSNIVFNSFNEGNFTQQDAVNGTDFDASGAKLHTTGVSFNDDFSEASINTNRWNVVPSGGTASINSGQLRLATSAANQNPSLTHKGVVGAGDFDVQVDFNNVSTSSSSWWATLQFTSNDGKGNMQNNIGQMGYYSRIYQDGNINYLITSRFDTGGKLRLTRVGTTGTVYALYNSTWNVLYTHATTDGPGYFSIYSGTTNSTVSCNFDNFTATGNLTNSTTYPTTQSYYITTANGSRLNSLSWAGINNVSLTQNTPTNTNIKYLISFDNRATWKYWNGSSWQASTLANIDTSGMTKATLEGISSGGWMASSGFTSGTLDFAISLSSTVSTNSPSISNIQVNYFSYPSLQTLTSNIYNTNSTGAALSTIAWSENLPTNTDIKFQLRTSPDGSTWTNWCGPDDGVAGTCSSATYFTDPNGSEVIDDTQKNHVGDQYFQYKVFLNSSDGNSTPILSDVTISYTTISIPSISTQSATNTTEHTATLNANITATGGDNPVREIQYGTTSGVYINSCTQGTGATGTYSCNLTNLTPNTTYYYRAKATNSAGTSYGNELSFTTLALQDTTLTDPDPTDISNATQEGYFTLNSGNITNTDSVTTTVNITVQDGIFHATFPQNTEITESTNQNFNFQNFTASNVTQTVRNDQQTTRAAVKIGIPGESLSFSQDVTLTVAVGQAFNGQTLDILYQNDNESDWHTQGTCTVENGNCTFTTNHATIYTINGEHKATGDTPMNLNVQVQETLSMDCFDPSDSNTTVSLGTAANPGMITAGTPAVGQSRCTVTTNADQGYYLTVENSNPTHATLTHTDPNTNTLYEISDINQWSEITKTTNNWNAPTTKGLGFSIIAFPEVDTTHNQFDGVWNETSQCSEGVGADANNYAGIPSAPQAISAVTSYQASATTTDICYKVDVPASQPSGQYSGQVTFTATSDASGYWE